jgi:signal transduction histidine kinase
MTMRIGWFKIFAWLGAAIVVAHTIGLVLVVMSDKGYVRRDLGYRTATSSPRLVTSSAPGQPFEAGDQLLTVNGQPLGAQFPGVVMDEFRPGDTYAVTVLRGGVPQTLTATVTGRPVVPPWSSFAATVARALVFLVCGLVIALRRPDDVVARWAVAACWLFALNTTMSVAVFVNMNGWNVPLPLQALRGLSSLIEWAGFGFLMRFPSPVGHAGIWRRLSWVVLPSGLALAMQAWGNVLVRTLPAEWVSWVWVLYVGPFGVVPISVAHYLALAAIVALVVYRLRAERQSQDCLRLAWLLVPIAVSAVLAAIAILAESVGGTPDRWLHGNLLVAPAIAYAVLAKGVLGFRMVVRRTMQYLLARPLVEAALLGPILLAAGRAAIDPERPVSALMHPVWLLPLAAAGVVVFPFVRLPLAQWIDRRFFREAWVEDQIVSQLVQRARACATTDTMAAVVRRGIDEAWHPEHLRLFAREHRDGVFRDAVHSEILREDSPLLRALAAGQVISAPDPAVGAEVVPWMLAVPLMSPSAQLLGALLVGEKKSHLPYSTRDRQVLSTLGTQIGLMLDHALLERERVDLVVAERTRIARELHDTLAQGFAVIGLHLDLGIQEASHEQSQWHMAEARRLARESLASARRSVHDLRSAAEQHLNVGQLLRDMTARLAPAFQVHHAIEETTAEMVPAQTRQHLLRVAQEALTNVVKHSGASRVEVALRREAEALVLEIVDNGKGFVRASSGHDGYGIVGMHERAQLVHAHLDVDSTPGLGTSVRLRVPVAT